MFRKSCNKWKKIVLRSAKNIFTFLLFLISLRYILPVLPFHLHKFFVLFLQAHNTEVAFYRLAKKYELNLKMPEIYFAQELSPISDCGLLFMEDAGETSYVIPPYEKTSVSEVKQVILICVYANEDL